MAETAASTPAIAEAAVRLAAQRPTASDYERSFHDIHG